jgi:hypothetical protein
MEIPLLLTSWSSNSIIRSLGETNFPLIEFHEVLTHSDGMNTIP